MRLPEQNGPVSCFLDNLCLHVVPTNCDIVAFGFKFTTHKKNGADLAQRSLRSTFATQAFRCRFGSMVTWGYQKVKKPKEIKKESQISGGFKWKDQTTVSANELFLTEICHHFNCSSSSDVLGRREKEFGVPLPHSVPRSWRWSSPGTGSRLISSDELDFGCFLMLKKWLSTMLKAANKSK